MEPIEIYKSSYTVEGVKYYKIMFHWRDGILSNKYVFSGFSVDKKSTYTLEKYSWIGDKAYTIYTKRVYDEVSFSSMIEELKNWFKYERNINNVSFIEHNRTPWMKVDLGDVFTVSDIVDKTVIKSYYISEIVHTDSRGGTRLITGEDSTDERWSFSVSNDELLKPYCYTESKFILSGDIK